MPKKLFSNLLILSLIVQASIGLFAFPNQAKAVSTTYYVDCNAANDLGAGTSSGTAWKTIAKVNSTLTGDQSDTTVLFNKGCTWREALTVPGFGTAGHPFTFGAYGTGANPIINGSDIISSWTSDTGPATETISRVGSPDNGGAFSFGWRHVIAANSFSNNGSAFRITFEARSDQAMTVTGVYIGKQAASGDAYDYDPTDNVQVLFGGSGSVVVSAGSTVTSDLITYPTTKTNTYIISYGTTGGYRGAYGGGNNAYVKTNDQNGFATADTSGYGSIIANWGGIVSFAIQYTAVGVANVWNSTVTTQPNAVYFDGVRGTLEASKAAITGANQWYWASNVLSVYSVGSPVLVSPGIEATARNYAVNTNSQNYITVQNISALKAALNGVLASWQPNTIVLDGMDVSDSYDSGVVVNGTSAGFTIKNSTVENSGLYGIIYNHPNGTNLYITNNTIQNNGWRPVNTSGWNGTVSSGEISGNTIVNNGIGSTAGFAHGLYNDTGQANSALKIYNNTISGNTKGAGILNKSSAEIYNNKIYSNNNEGISTGQNGTNNVVYNIHNNIIYSNNGGVAIKTKGAGTIDSTIYNNTLYQNGAAHEIYVGDNDTSLILKNNIVSALDTGDNATIATQGAMTSTNNVWYRPAGFTLTYGGSSKNWSQWTTLGFDSNSINSDPKFTTNGSNFSLLSSSPAIDHGVSLGDTYKLSLNPNSVWPSSVNTLDQTLNGPGWEIGAYVYSQSTAPTISISTPSAGVVSGSSVTLSASASPTSPATISSVQYYLDDVALSSTISSSPYNYAWNTTSTSNASHSLLAVAHDSYGIYATSSPVTVTVDNLAPVITMNGGDTTLNFGQAYSDLGATALDARQGDLTSNIVTANHVNTSVAGTYTITYDVSDDQGNTATQAVRTVVVKNAAGNGAPVGLIGQHRQDVSNLISTTISTTSLQNQIVTLTAQLNSLQSQMNSTTGNTKNNFVRNLSLHNSGADVKSLQQYLNTHGFVISTSGAGSPGNETNLFGSLTYKALQKFQKSIGLPATGFFGPLTRAYIAKY